MKLLADVHAHVAGLPGVVLHAVVGPAAIQHVERQAAPLRHEHFTQVAVLELLDLGRRCAVARLDHRRQVEPGTVEPVEVIAMHLIVPRRGRHPAPDGRGVHRGATGAADHHRPRQIDVVVPGEGLFLAARRTGEVVVPLVRLAVQGVDAGLRKARGRGDVQSPGAARGQSLLRQRQNAVRHLVEFVQDHEIGIHAGDLAAAVGPPQEAVARADALEPLAVRALAGRGFRLQAAPQVGAVLDRPIEAGLGEVIHQVLGGHQVEHIAAPRVGRVGRPQGLVDEQLRQPDLGGFLNHHDGVRVARDRGQGRQMEQRAIRLATMIHGPRVRVVRVAAPPLPPEGAPQAR